MVARFQPGVGEIILQAAQGIVQQAQNQQRLRLQAEQFEEQVGQQEKVLDLRQKELEIRDRTIAVQEGQLQRQLEQAPARAAQAQADIAKTEAETQLAQARTVKALQGGGSGGLTANQRFDAIQDIEQRAMRLEMSQTAQQFEEAQGIADSLPRLGSPEEYLRERRRLRTAVNKFQTSATAVQAQLMLQRSGSQEQEIDTLQRQLDILDSFVESELFKGQRDQLDAQGARPDSRQAIIDNFFPGFRDQLSANEGPTRVQSFSFGTVPSDDVDNAWALFEQGNVDVLADVALRATGGGFTAADKAAFEAELLRRFPAPGEEQDAAIASWRRMFERIRAQQTE